MKTWKMIVVKDIAFMAIAQLAMKGIRILTWEEPVMGISAGPMQILAFK